MSKNITLYLKRAAGICLGLLMGGSLLFGVSVPAYALETDAYPVLEQEEAVDLVWEQEEETDSVRIQEEETEAVLLTEPEIDPDQIWAEEQSLYNAGDVLEDMPYEADVYTDEGKVSLEGLYLPDVTPEMSYASYWTGKLYDPDAVLADREMISAVNEDILYGEGTNMNDLANWSEDYYNGVALNEALASSGLADAQYFYNVGVRFDDDGSRFPSWEDALETLFQPMIDNCQDPDAEEKMPVKFAVCTNRTCMLSFPTSHPLYDDPTDPDFDYLYQTMLRVNEPLVLKARSADGNYYLAISSCVSGWVAAEDVAICADKEEWLSAWDLPDEKTLVVCDDKIYTEDSNYAPETAERMLPMGTCLELADEEDYAGLIINRSAYNNHVVWLPVRLEDGSYTKELALIGENRDVSEGYLPLTSANLLSVMMNQLGDTYGWGGMLDSEDCSGFARDVYKCFGIEMARNTTWQANQPVFKFALGSMTAEEKAEIIRDLPPGSLLIFSSHAMLYLGEDNGRLYVISSISDVMVDGKRARVRGGLINTLDIKRANGLTWLEALHTAEIPYYTQDYSREFTYRTTAGDGQEWIKGSTATADFTFVRTVNNASVTRHFTGLFVDGDPVDPADYSVEEGMTVRLSPEYLSGLEPGKHFTEAAFDDGNSAEASFAIIEKITGLSLDRSSAVMVTGGKDHPSELQLSAQITPADTTEDKGISWTSSDEDIAAVDENGKVTALRYGTAVITAASKADPAIQANCRIKTLYYDVTGSGVRGAADYKYWFNPVYWAADNGITRGYDNIYFGPEENCRREQMVTFLWRQAGQPEPKGTATPFSDVKQGAYYYKAVLWAYENGITYGYSTGKYKGKFGVGLTVTREDHDIHIQDGRQAAG